MRQPRVRRTVAKADKNKDSRGKPEITPEARRKQIFVGIIMGAVIGVVISALTEFWYYLPAGIALGLATGAIMKPPAE